MKTKGAREIRRFVQNLIQNEEGQATVEYILLLSVVISIATILVRGLTAVLDRGVLKFGGTLERKLKSGKAPLYVWEN